MTRSCHYRLLSELSFIPRLTRDYLSQQRSGDPFQNLPEFPESRRNLLSDVLNKQHSGFTLSSYQKKNLSKVRDANTFFIVTGHQCCLLSGPLYVTIKILNAIKLADHLNQRNSGKQFIPLLWLHTEDHDLDEIDHVILFGKKIQWDHKQSGEAGKLHTGSMEGVFEGLRVILEKEKFGKDLLKLMREHYSGKLPLAEATRGFLQQLFGKYGLLILDPSVKELKSLFVPFMHQEIEEQMAEKSVLKENEDLKKAGYEPVVNPRSVNMFYLSDGKRERIVSEKGTFQTLDKAKSWDKGSLLKEMNESPERFSPNVILRALYQQVAVPSVAYVGGPSEIAYWLQFRSLFRKCALPFPELVLRNSVFLLDEGFIKKWESLGISVDRITDPLQENMKKVSVQDLSGFDFDGSEQQITAVMDALSAKILLLDPSLKPSVEAERTRLKKSLDALKEKSLRALKQKQDSAPSRLEHLYNRVFPGGIPLERTESFMHWYAALGPDFFDTLLSCLEPYPQHAIISEF